MTVPLNNDKPFNFEGKLIKVEQETGYLVVKGSDGIEKKYRVKIMQGSKDITPTEDKINLSNQVASLLNKKWETTKPTDTNLSNYTITKESIEHRTDKKQFIPLDPNEFIPISNIFNKIKTEIQKNESENKIKQELKNKITSKPQEDDTSWAITKFFKNSYSKVKEKIFGKTELPKIEENDDNISIILQELNKENYDEIDFNQSNEINKEESEEEIILNEESSDDKSLKKIEKELNLNEDLNNLENTKDVQGDLPKE